MAVIFIALGGLIFVVSLIGCCGSSRESRCLLNTYALLLLLLLGAQIGIGVFAFVERGHLVVAMNQTAWQKIPIAQRNVLEDDFACCGWTTYDEQGMCAAANPKYAPFCAPVIRTWLHNHYFIIAIVALVVGAIQLFGLVVSCCLSAAINASHKAQDRERLLNEAREANRMPPPGGYQQQQYNGYGYK